MRHGGWFPLLIAGIVYLADEDVARRTPVAGRAAAVFDAFDGAVRRRFVISPPTRVPGMAVFMTGNPMGTPLALRQNVAHNHVLHERNIILGVQTAETPYVADNERLETEEIGEGFFRVSLAYGFMEEPDVPRDLKLADCIGNAGDPQSLSYFLGRETVLATRRAGMALWRESLFAFMARNALPATLFFRLPADRVVEIGASGAIGALLAFGLHASFVMVVLLLSRP